MVTEITREELQQKLEHPKKSVVLEEYRRAHIPGALNMPPEVRALASGADSQKGFGSDRVLCWARLPCLEEGC